MVDKYIGPIIRYQLNKDELKKLIDSGQFPQLAGRNIQDLTNPRIYSEPQNEGLMDAHLASFGLTIYTVDTSSDKPKMTDKTSNALITALIKWLKSLNESN